jgi:hypothetical protein
VLCGVEQRDDGTHVQRRLEVGGDAACRGLEVRGRGDPQQAAGHRSGLLPERGGSPGVVRVGPETVGRPVGDGCGRRRDEPGHWARASSQQLLPILPAAGALFAYVGAESVLAGWFATLLSERVALGAPAAALGTSAF